MHHDIQFLYHNVLIQYSMIYITISYYIVAYIIYSIIIHYNNNIIKYLRNNKINCIFKIILYYIIFHYVAEFMGSRLVRGYGNAVPVTSPA